MRSARTRSGCDRAAGIVVLVAIAGVVDVGSADVVYVDHAAPDGGDGTTWATAFTSTYAAQKASDPGDELWVASGQYGNVSLRNGIAVYGGFAGDEVERHERDWVVNVTQCGSVLANHVELARLDGFSTGSLVFDDSELEVGHCVVDGHAGILAVGGAVVLDDCVVANNEAVIGAGLYARDLSTLVIRDCQFVGNEAEVGTGAAFLWNIDELIVERTVFRENHAFTIGGVSIGPEGGPATFVDCQFIGNVSDTQVGALGTAVPTTFTNCVFANNTAVLAAGFLVAEASTITNCSVSGNDGGGVYVNTSKNVSITNSIIWGNTPGPFGDDQSHFSVTFSNVEGGWPGDGNIDADPLFVQAGAADLRLSAGSPCIDAGDSSAVSPDVLLDVAGNPRIIGAAVDMGAYEGVFDAKAPADTVDDLDEGEVAFLVPDGTGYDPMSFATVVVRNLTGGDDGAMDATEYSTVLHPDAGGFSELAHLLTLGSSLEEGTFIATVSIPFTAADLGGADPVDVDLTTHDAGAGNWAIAAIANTEDSPGHDRRFGDRIVSVSSGGFALSTDLGDYGVVWNPDEQRGFAWALVDHLGDFGVGAPLCPSDARQPPSGVVGFEDLEFVLSAWGEGDGPFDVDGSGGVDVLDLLAVLGRWGVCSE